MKASMLSLFASRKTAIILLIAAMLTSLLYAQFDLANNYPLLLILALLTINLVTCLILNSKRIWRRSPALYLFHIGLIGIAVFSLIGGLTYFHGYFRLAEKQEVQDDFSGTKKGLLYKNKLDGLLLSLEESRVEFHGNDLGVATDEQTMLLRRPGEAGAITTLIFNKPLLVGHYRFYLAMDHGYAVVFKFTDRNSNTYPGVVYLADYPINRTRQIESFTVPGSTSGQISVRSKLDSWPYNPKAEWSLDIPENPQITVNYSSKGRRHSANLKQGEELRLGGGTLTFESMRRWHGFLVDYDPARIYLSISVAIGLIGLTWHYVAISFRKPKRRKG